MLDSGAGTLTIANAVNHTFPIYSIHQESLSDSHNYKSLRAGVCSAAVDWRQAVPAASSKIPIRSESSLETLNSVEPSSGFRIRGRKLAFNMVGR